MARVTVTLYATFREAAGRSTLSIEADELEGLLGKLRASSTALAKAFEKAGGWVVLVNGKNARLERRELVDGDEVAVFPPVTGG